MLTHDWSTVKMKFLDKCKHNYDKVTAGTLGYQWRSSGGLQGWFLPRAAGALVVVLTCEEQF